VKKNLKLPQNLNMERELLSMMLINGGAIVPTVNSILTADDFYFPDHQIVYQTMLNLYENHTPPNIISVIDELKRNDQLSKRLLEFVVTLGEHAFSTAYAESWAKRIRELSTLRRAIQLTEKITHDAYRGKKSVDEILTDTENALCVISNKGAKDPIERAFFLANFFETNRDCTQKYSERKTGFSNIDQLQIFSPGLYLIGATPACGKTTFCWQLLEQFAECGETCFFCSYEMATFELVTKSIAREMFKRDPYTEITAADIRNGATSNLFHDVFNDLAREKNSVKLFELRDENVDDLLRILRPHCNDKGKSPIVCVDYLQIIPPSNDLKLTTDKARIDDIVHKLKTFQRETNTTFIVISSFNRVNYYQQVSFESFKDSGNIEYTADVVWALQMFVANSIKDGAHISSTRKKFDDAKLQKPREIQLKCLKNRQGNNYDCYFNYYSAHDYFEPATLTDFEAEEKAAQDESKDTAQKDTTDSNNVNDKTGNDTEFWKKLSDEESRALDDFFDSLSQQEGSR